MSNYISRQHIQQYWDICNFKGNTNDPKGNINSLPYILDTCPRVPSRLHRAYQNDPLVVQKTSFPRKSCF